MSKKYMQSVHLKNYDNGLESVLSQSSLGNAREICSTVENVLTLTYLNNKHFHMQVSQHTIKDRDSIIIRSLAGVYSVPEVPVESFLSSSCLMDHISGCCSASRTPRTGWVMSSVKCDAKIELHTELQFWIVGMCLALITPVGVLY